jgi:hypothetical protein
MSNTVAGIVYQLDPAYPSPEAGAIVLEISTQGRTASGLDDTNRLICIFVIRGGKIKRFRAYFNLATMACPHLCEKFRPDPL